MATCKRCGQEVVHVRDDYTGATFPVDADPTTVEGFTLSPAREGERNQRATRELATLYVPHELRCQETTEEEV